MSTSFLCQCGGHTSVVDSRQTAAKTIRRRRKCLTCSGRFTTYELELGEYHTFLKDLKILWDRAGLRVREMGSEREPQ